MRQKDIFQIGQYKYKINKKIDRLENFMGNNYYAYFISAKNRFNNLTNFLYLYIYNIVQ